MNGEDLRAQLAAAIDQRIRLGAIVIALIAAIESGDWAAIDLAVERGKAALKEGT